ncbi:MAG: hypothetical protein QXU81_09020 [Candidatus Bathyarchaeia archaeon]
MRVGKDVCKYVDFEVQPFKVYVYIIIAENELGSSKPSNEVIVFSCPSLFGDIRISMALIILVSIIVAAIILLLKIKNKNVRKQ